MEEEVQRGARPSRGQHLEPLHALQLGSSGLATSALSPWTIPLAPSLPRPGPLLAEAKIGVYIVRGRI